jgi:hypothetical protein
MADKKISALTSASTPLAGTEVLPIVQSGATVKVAVSDLTAGRAVAASTLALSGGAAFGGAALDNGVGRLIVDSSNLSYAITGIGNDQSSARIRLKNTATGGGDYAFVAGENNVGQTGFTLLKIGTGTTLALDDGSGNTVIKNGNLVIGTSGQGVDFSATPGTGTSELFADYEEGIFTPTVGGTWTTNPTGLNGTYTKMGRTVYITLTFTGGAKTSGTSGWIDSMPYSINVSGTGSVVDSNIVSYGSVLAANTTRAWLTSIVFGAGTNYVSFSYMV